MGIPSAPATRGPIRDVADVDLLVRRFCQAVIPDPVLGPIFHGFGVDWSVHVPKLVDFWANRLLGVEGYVGNAVAAHQPVLDRFPFGAGELDRWLELWRETVDELFVGEVAELTKQRAGSAAAAIGTLVRRHGGDVGAQASVPANTCQARATSLSPTGRRIARRPGWSTSP